MVQRRGRRSLGVISGVVWGLGVAVLIQQLGWRPLDPLVLYGVPLVAAAVSGVWGGRRVPAATAAVLIAVPGFVFAQDGECSVEVNGDSLTESSIADPVVIEEDFEAIEVAFAVDEGQGEVWVGVGGFRIPVDSGPVGGSGTITVGRGDLGPFAGSGLYHVGGSVEGGCTGEGYVRIEGGPWDDPIGQAALGAIGLGLLGTWFAGRRPRPARRVPDRPEHGEQPEPEPAERQPESREVGAPGVSMLRPQRLHAALFEEATGEALGAFVAGASHRIEVRLGAAEPAWSRAAPVVDATPRELRVVFTEPTILHEPVVATVRRAGGAASGPAAFDLTLPPGTTSVNARLIAVQDNRILHTVRLPDTVVSSPAEVASAGTTPDVASPETTVAAVPPASGSRRFDVALLANHSGGRPTVTAVADDAAALVDIGEGDVAESVEKIRTRLGEVVEQPEEFAALDDPGTVELLVFLAHHGRLLRNALVGDFLDDRLATATALQIVSATPDAYFPIEFAYDHPAPAEDAGLCPGAAAALRAGDPLATCDREHTSAVVCPLGFWGTSRVIERHAHQPGDALPAGFLLRSVPTPVRGTLVPGSIVYAASDRVDAVAEGAVEALASRLATAGETVEARKWDEWIADVAAGPALTIALPHTVYSDTLDTYGLEIGTSDRRWAGDIDARFVPPEERPVITVLLGCETAAAGRVSYERFPGLFRRAGAEVVFGTLTEILGRHAAPVAAALAERLTMGWRTDEMRLGEVMVRLRRSLLADGVIAVLAVVAFGDADWVLRGRGPGADG